MTQWVPSMPCDASGGEAAPLLDLEQCAPEEQAAPSPADDDGDATTCGQWFLRVILGAVWLYVVNGMRIYYSACDDAESRALVAVFMVVIAMSLASVFYTICIGEEPVDITPAPSHSRDEPSLFML